MLPVSKRHRFGNHTSDVNLLRFQKSQRRFKPAAARTDDSNFIHYDWRRIELNRAMNCRLQEYRSSWARHLNRLLKTFSGPGSLDDPLVHIGRKLLLNGRDGHARLFCNPHFVFVASIKMSILAVGIQHLCHQQAEFSIAHHSDLCSIRNVCLIEDFARRGQWLDEHSLLIGYRIGHDVEIRFGQCEKFAKCARMPDNAEDRSRRTMAPEALSTPFTFSACQVDFTHNPPGGKIRIICTHNLSHKLMAWRSAESVIPALQFEICVANAPHEQPNCGESFRRARPAHIPHFHTSIFKMDCKH